MLEVSSFFSFFLFFSSCLMSICNPVGYDRLEHLYIHRESSPDFRPSIFHFRAVLPRLIDNFWRLSPPDSALFLIPHAVPRLPDHSFAAILVLIPSLLLFPPLQLISKNPKRDPSPFHLRATMLALFSLSSLASGFLLCTEF